MRKIAFGVAGFIALLVVAGLLAPRFLDWNHYKADIESQVRAATGRELKIGGNLDISILPQPTLVAEGLHLANVKGAAVGDMVALDRLEVRLAILPLLTGTVEASSLILVRPTVELETLNDGRANWILGPEQAAPPAKSGLVEPPPRRSSSTFRVSRATIVDGAIVYRDSRTGMLERIDDLDAEMTMDAANGPMRVVGSGAPRGVRARFEAHVGALGRAAPIPLSLNIDLDGGAARLSLDGTASQPDDKGEFTGKLRIEATDPVKLARTVFGGGSATSGLPSALAQRVEIQSDIAASASHLALSNLSLRHGESSATGGLSARFEKATQIEARLVVDRLDLDAFVADRPQPQQAQKAETAAFADKAKPGDKGPAPGAAFEIPADVTGNVDIAINSLVAHGGEVRNAQVVGTIGGGRITLTKAAATLPGDTAVTVAGSIGAKKGAPVADGTLNLSSGNARALLQWLKADLSSVPEDRLRRLTLQTRFAASGDEVQIRELQAAFDQTKLSGGATIALRQRPAFGVTVTADRLDLDAYMARDGKTGASAEGQPPTQSQQAPGGAEGKPRGPLAALAPLEAFDANMQARIGQLRYKGIDAQGIAVDASLVNGTLTVKDASVKDMAGASGRISGTLGGFTGTPAVRANLNLQAADGSDLLGRLGVSQKHKLGRLAVTGTVTSNAQDAALDLSLGVAGGSLKVQGPIKNLDQPSYDLALNADFANAGPLLGRDTLPLRLTGKAQGDAKALSLAGLKGKIGPAAISGDINVSMAEVKPKVAVSLTTGDLPMEILAAPAAKTSTGTAGAASGQAGAKQGAAVSKGEERWSREPMDLSALKTFDGEFHVTSSALKSGKVSLNNAVIDAIVKDGRFELRGLTGKLFNGALDLKGKASAADGADFALNLAQFDVNQALRQLADLDRATGTANFKANIRGGLKSEWDFVSSLAGQGAVDGTVSAKVKGEQSGAALLGALAGQAGGLGQGIEGALNGLLMAFGSGQGTLKGTFQAEKGVIRTNDLQLVNAQATTRVTGAANLPSWTLDGEGQVVPAKAQQPLLTAAAKGPLDKPDIKIGGTVLQDLGRGALQQVLPGLLGKPPASPSGQSGGSQTAPADQQQKQKINPKDVLKNLLKQPGG